MKILVTGSEGLIGRAFAERCRQTVFDAGHEVVGFDLKLDEGLDIRRESSLIACIDRHQPDGIVHLAAFSRVIWGESDPEGCIQTNVIGTRNVFEAAWKGEKKLPFVVFASSREVYGNSPDSFVRESSPIQPVSVYGRTKAVGEDLAMAYRRKGLRTAVLRFSNVYGDVRDHESRAIPAFCRAAVKGGIIRIAGPQKIFDFTHVNDTARAILAACKALHAGDDAMPTIHVTTGIGSELGSVVKWCQKWRKERAIQNELIVKEVSSSSHEVEKFVGDNARLTLHLGIHQLTPMSTGIIALCEDFARLPATV